MGRPRGRRQPRRAHAIRWMIAPGRSATATAIARRASWLRISRRRAESALGYSSTKDRDVGAVYLPEEQASAAPAIIVCSGPASGWGAARPPAQQFRPLALGHRPRPEAIREPAHREGQVQPLVPAR